MPNTTRTMIKIPKDLSDSAKEIWKEKYAQITKGEFRVNIGVLDETLFKSYVIAIDMYNKVYKEWKDTGEKTKIYEIYKIDAEGNTFCEMIPNPLIKELRECEKRMTALASELGFTPDKRMKQEKFDDKKRKGKPKAKQSNLFN